MTTKKIRIIPPGYTDVLHPETDSLAVLMQDASTLESFKTNTFKRFDNRFIDITQAPYNADSTGTTDSSTAFRNALLTAQTNGYANIFVPNGTFIIDTGCEVFSNTHIVFARGSKITKTTTGSDSHIFDLGYSSTTKGYGGGASNILFEGGYFTGNATDVKGICISCHHVNNLTLRNMTFYDAMYDNHILDLSGCSNILIDNCTIQGFTPQATRGYIEAIQLDSSYNGALAYKASGGFDGLATKNVTVQNCRFLPIRNTDGSVLKVSPNPIGSHHFVAKQYFKNIKFIDNVVEDCLGTGIQSNTGSWIRIYAIDGLIIRGNTFLNTNSSNNNAIMLECKATGTAFNQTALDANPDVSVAVTPLPPFNVLITGNTFNGFNTATTGRSIIGVEGYNGGTNYYAYNIKIINNHFENCFDVTSANKAGTANSGEVTNWDLSQECINVNFVNGLLIQGNTCLGVRRLIYCRDSFKVSILDNIVKNAYYLAIYITNTSKVKINGNTVDYCNGGIYVATSEQCHVMNNSVTNSYDYVSVAYTSIIALKTLINCFACNNIITALASAHGDGYAFGMQAYTNGDRNFLYDNIVIGYTTPMNITGTCTNSATR